MKTDIRWTGEKVKKKTRIYFLCKKSEHDDITNRKTQPTKYYRNEIASILTELGLPADTKVRFSQRAGCSMCPCSPGFIIENHWDREVYVTDGGDE